MKLDTRLVDVPFAPAEALKAFTDSGAGVGAIVTFSGVARPSSSSGSQVEALHLHAHPRLTALSLERIGRDGLERFDLSQVLIIHRSGRILPGEAIVFVAAASSHRRAAFLGADYLMDRLKTEAVFWKQEEGQSSSRWIEPTAEDKAAAGRWEQTWPESTKA